MPYRLLSYIVEIWRRYGKNEKLPLVIPCVLYTGNSRWGIKTLRSLFDVSHELEKYIPDFEYILIDVNRYSDEELIETANLVSSVVYMAKSKDKNEVANKLRNIIDLIAKLDKKEQDEFVRWAEVMFYKSDKVVYDYFEKNLKRGANKDMALIDLIPGAIEIFRDEGRVEGREEGRKEGEERGKILGRIEGIREGEEKGKIEAKRSSIKRILTKKLKKEPSENVICRLEGLTLEELEEIEDRIFEIEDWNEI